MKIVRYKKLAIIVLMSLTVSNLYASDNDDDINSRKNRIATFKNHSEYTKRTIIAQKLKHLQLKENLDIQGFFLGDCNSRDNHSLEESLNGLPSEKLTALYFIIDKLECEKYEGLSSNLLARSESIQAQDDANQLNIPVAQELAGQDLTSRFMALGGPCPPQDQADELIERINKLSVPSRKPVSSVLDNQSRLFREQASATKEQTKQEKELFGLKKEALALQIQREKSALALSIVMTLGEPWYKIFVERYANGIFNGIENILGFGPSEEELKQQQKAMFEMQRIQQRFVQAELGEKELKVALLEAALKQKEVAVQRDEILLQAEVVNQRLSNQIVLLTMKKFEQGKDFKEQQQLTVLENLYKKREVAHSRIQELKIGSGKAIPGVA